MHWGDRARGLGLTLCFFSQGVGDERAKVERVSEALQFSVIVEWRWMLSAKPQALQELDFFLGYVTPHRSVPEEFFKSRLFLGLSRFPFDKLEFLCIIRNKSPVQDDFHAEGREIDIPGFDQGIQEGNAVLDGHVEDIRVEKLEDADPHRLITSAAKSRYRVEPGFIRQLVFRDSLDNVQQLLCDEALEFAEGLLLENHPYLVLFVGRALAENQLSNFFEQWLGWAQVSL